MARFDAQKATRDIMAKSKKHIAREDTTALLLAKLGEIVLDTDGNAVRQIGMDIAEDRDRAYGCLMALMSLVVQYSERSTGLITLCNYLTSKHGQEEALMPGLSDAKW